MAIKGVAWEDVEVIDVQCATNGACGTSTVFVCDRQYELLMVQEVHGTAGTDAGTVSIDIMKATGTTAPGSGTSVLSSVFNAKSTINTVVTKSKALGTLAAQATRTFAPGDRVAVVFTGTLTALAGVAVSIYLKPLKKSNLY